MMSTAIVPGSLSALAQSSGMSLAESFLSCDVLVVVDVSGSMDTDDSRGNRRRFDVAVEELRRLQGDLPGKVGVVAFSTDVQFCPGGQPLFLGGGTDLTRALQFVKVADGTVQFIVVSDGLPDSPPSALATARQFKSRIDCIYVGPEADRRGADFLRQLAQQSGGRYVVADRAAELAMETKRLLLSVAT